LGVAIFHLLCMSDIFIAIPTRRVRPVGTS